MNRKMLLNIALFIALLFHVCGVFGILFTSKKDWFIYNTPLNLLLMVALLIVTHPSKNKNFFSFFLITAIVGFAVEVIGVNTHVLFGNYNYGDVLGLKVLNVPLIIGLNWFLIIYCAGTITQVYESYVLKKINEQGIDMNKKIKAISFVVDASLLTVLFDWLIEPVAIKLGFWQWQNGIIPLFNYACWIFISIILLTLFRKLNADKRNIFAVHLFIIQVLFFLVLRTFL